MNSELAARVYRERVQATMSLDPKVSLVLKGQEYFLEFNNKAVIDLLRATGFNLLSDALTQDKVKDPSFLCDLIRYGLMANHPDVTTEEVNRIFTLKHFPYVMNQIREAIRGYLPDMTDIDIDEESKGAEGHQDPT